MTMAEKLKKKFRLRSLTQLLLSKLKETPVSRSSIDTKWSSELINLAKLPAIFRPHSLRSGSTFLAQCAMILLTHDQIIELHDEVQTMIAMDQASLLCILSPYRIIMSVYNEQLNRMVTETSEYGSCTLFYVADLPGCEMVPIGADVGTRTIEGLLLLGNCSWSERVQSNRMNRSAHKNLLSLLSSDAEVILEKISDVPVTGGSLVHGRCCGPRGFYITGKNVLVDNFEFDGSLKDNDLQQALSGFRSRISEKATGIHNIVSQTGLCFGSVSSNSCQHPWTISDECLKKINWTFPNTPITGFVSDAIFTGEYPFEKKNSSLLTMITIIRARDLSGAQNPPAVINVPF